MEPDRTYFQILKVTKDAPAKEIKRAYHTLARKYHPDKASSPEQQAEFEEEFSLISEAYNVMKDDTRREGYLAKLKKNTEAARDEAFNDTPGKTKSAPAVASQSPSSQNLKVVDSGRANIAQKAYVKGYQLYQLGEYNRAIEFFEASIKNDPTQAQYFTRLAMALMKAKRSFTKAVEHAKKACDLDNYNIDYKINLANIYEEAGSNSLAIQALEEVLRWDNSNATALGRIDQLRNPHKSGFLGNILNKFRK